MIRIQSWLVELLLRALDPSERDAVDGDLNELRVPPRRAIRELLDLLARRRVAAWMDWRPWAALIIVVLPLGFALSVISRFWALGTAIHVWLYVENWTSAYLASPGARSDLFGAVGTHLIECVALMLWAWTIGFAVASVSRRAKWETFALFALVVFAGTIGSTTAGVLNPANAAVFSLTSYRVGFPIVFRTVFILLPALHGTLKAVRESTIGSIHAAILAITVTLVTAALAVGIRVAVTFGWWSLSAEGPMMSALAHLRRSWQFWVLPVVMTLPAAYVVYEASWRSPRTRRIT